MVCWGAGVAGVLAPKASTIDSAGGRGARQHAMTNELDVSRGQGKPRAPKYGAFQQRARFTASRYPLPHATLGIAGRDASWRRVWAPHSREAMAKEVAGRQAAHAPRIRAGCETWQRPSLDIQGKVDGAEVGWGTFRQWTSRPRLS